MTAGIRIMDILAVFGAGVIVSFTPCVYPVIPLTVASIAGANVNGSRLRAFFLSLIYVLGLAIVYSIFAVVAALTGSLFGKLQNSPVMFAVMAGIFLLFALVMFDLVHWKGIAFTSSASSRPQNVWSVFLAGAASGMVIGPCTAPVLSSLLLYIGARQNIVLGIFLVFIFSYGVGTSMIIVGTFSGILGSLPKSGVWLVWVKRACGLVFLFASVYFLYQFFQVVY